MSHNSFVGEVPDMGHFLSSAKDSKQREERALLRFIDAFVRDKEHAAISLGK